MRDAFLPSPSAWRVRALIVGWVVFAMFSSLHAGEGTRVIYENQFEVDNVPFSKDYDLDVFGWEQRFDRLDLPHLMAATPAAVGSAGASGRVLKLPAGGGRALLYSRRNISRYAAENRPADLRQLPVEPGELLTFQAAFRHDDLGQGDFELAIRFSFEVDAAGREFFREGRGEDLVPLFTGGGARRGWRTEHTTTIVPEGTVGWRLELRLHASLEKSLGFLEIDAIRVIASPRLVLAWVDSLRRVSGNAGAPVQITSVGLPTGDYTLDLAVIDDRGEVYNAEQLIRYVDDEHPIHLNPTGSFLTGGQVSRRAHISVDENSAGIRFLVVNLKDSKGDKILFREVPFLTGDPPFTVGRGRSRHGVLVPVPLPDWVGPFEPYPTLLAAPPGLESWPGALASVPEVRRAALFSLTKGSSDEDTIERTAADFAPLWRAVPRWYLDPPPDEPELLAALSSAARDLRIGVVGDGDGFETGVPRLMTIDSESTVGKAKSGRFAARFYGAAFGTDPEDWTTALFQLDADGASNVYIADPSSSLFRPGSSALEGYTPLVTLLAWQFARGYLGPAQFIGREEWRADAEALLYRRDNIDAVALIAHGDRFQLNPLTLQVARTPRAFDALGREVELPPVEDGRLTLELGGSLSSGRFLLIEGLDLSLERTGRSLAITSIEGGFRMSLVNHLSGRTTLDPEAEFPRGYRLLTPIDPRTVEAGETATWDLKVELPPSAGIAGTEWVRGSLVVRRDNGRTDRVPFEEVIPLDCSRVQIERVEDEAAGSNEITFRITNDGTVPITFHLYLQATPDGRGERTVTDERLGGGESREYVLPLNPLPRSASAAGTEGGSLWVGVTFTDGERGYCNRTFGLK